MNTNVHVIQAQAADAATSAAQFLGLLFEPVMV
jgi:hypothetical protein